ncbi:MAG: thiamine pyrophosphate-dependent enzyme, partial [Bryobacteraceae bacterium]
MFPIETRGSIAAFKLFDRNEHGKPVIPKDPRSIYSFGLLIRKTEQLLLRLFSQGLLSGTTHTCLGQEICQMAVVRALSNPGDVVLSNHRNHGHFLTYSGDFTGLVAEVMGRERGVCRGIGGSQHIAYRHFHSNGVQAGMTGIGAGHALAIKKRGEQSIVVTIVGDGTFGEGLLYESMNLASIWELPLLFVVENNGIAQTTATSETIGGSIEARGSAFGLRTWRLDDAEGDFLARAESVVGEIRDSRRPGFLVIDTMRMGPHSKGDDLRSEPELAAIRERDPLGRVKALLPREEQEAIEAATEEFIQSVHDEALNSPESLFEEIPSCIFTPRPGPSPGVNINRGNQTVRASLNRALRDLLSENSDVLLFGEDLHDPYGGAFKVTAGLSTQFPGRVISTPISEAGVMGAAIGLALEGFRPVVEIMFADFATLAMDQLFNHAVKFPGMFREASVPLVVRTPGGGRRGYGPTHSQSVENLLTGVPGLTVVFGSNRHDPGEL